MAINRTVLPRWATVDVIDGTTGLNNVVEPSEAKKDGGWGYLEKPARQYFNWLGRQTDAWFNYLDESTNSFAPYESNPNVMTIEVGAGRINQGTSIIQVSLQTSPIMTAPLTNPRIDRVVLNESTGLAEIVVGVEDVAPVPPPFTSTAIAIANVYLVVGITSITNDEITDERSRNPFTGSLDSSLYIRDTASDEIGIYHQNQTTGLSNTDGLFVGIDINEKSKIWNYENTDFLIGINNRLAGKITSAGRWLISVDGTDIAPQYDLVINNSNASTPVYIQVTNGTTGSGISDGFSLGIDSIGGVDIWNAENQDLRFATNSTVRGKFAASGRMLLTVGGIDISPERELVLYDGSVGGQVFMQFINDSTGITSGDGFIVGIDSVERPFFWNYGATDIIFGVAGKEVLKIESTGKLLVTPDGSDNVPLHNLVVIGAAANSSSYAQFANDATGVGVASGFVVGVNTIEQAEIWNFHNSDLRFATNNTFRGKIDNSGKWLISPDGTNIEPARELVIYSTSSGDSFIQFVNSSTGILGTDGFIIGQTSGEVAHLWNYENTDIQFGTNSIFRGKIDNGGKWLISPDGTNLEPQHELVLYKNSASQNCFAQFINYATGNGISDGFIVGISTLEDAELWNFENTNLNFATNNTFRGKIDNSGNWLISPDGIKIEPLHELVLYKSSGASDCNMQFVNSATNNGGSDGLVVGIGSDESARIINYENTPLKFFTNGSERFKVEADGSVEIGTGLVNQGVGTLNALNGIYANNIKIPTHYSGIINSDGTATSLPIGWTSTKLANGYYRITHGLGTTNYTILGIVSWSSFPGFCSLHGKFSSYFELKTYTNNGTTQDIRFEFMLFV